MGVAVELRPTARVAVVEEAFDMEETVEVLFWFVEGCVCERAVVRDMEPDCEVEGLVVLAVAELVVVESPTMERPVGAVIDKESAKIVAVLIMEPALSTPTCWTTDKVVVTWEIASTLDRSVVSEVTACFL